MPTISTYWRFHSLTGILKFSGEILVVAFPALPRVIPVDAWENVDIGWQVLTRPAPFVWLFITHPIKG